MVKLKVCRFSIWPCCWMDLCLIWGDFCLHWCDFGEWFNDFRSVFAGWNEKMEEMHQAIFLSARKRLLNAISIFRCIVRLFAPVWVLPTASGLGEPIFFALSRSWSSLCRNRPWLVEKECGGQCDQPWSSDNTLKKNELFAGYSAILGNQGFDAFNTFKSRRKNCGSFWCKRNMPSNASEQWHHLRIFEKALCQWWSQARSCNPKLFPLVTPTRPWWELAFFP